MGRTTHLIIVDSKDPKKSKPWLIIALVVSIIGFLLAVLGFALRIMQRRRARRAKDATNIDGEVPPEEDPAIDDASTLDPPKQKEHPYYNSTGYEASPDQNQTLLGNTEGAPITRWDSDSDAVAGLQRPASIASSFTAPPRYE